MKKTNLIPYLIILFLSSCEMTNESYDFEFNQKKSYSNLKTSSPEYTYNIQNNTKIIPPISNIYKKNNPFKILLTGIFLLSSIYLIDYYQNLKSVLYNTKNVLNKSNTNIDNKDLFLSKRNLASNPGEVISQNSDQSIIINTQFETINGETTTSQSAFSAIKINEDLFAIVWSNLNKIYSKYYSKNGEVIYDTFPISASLYSQSYANIYININQEIVYIWREQEYLYCKFFDITAKNITDKIKIIDYIKDIYQPRHIYDPTMAQVSDDLSIILWKEIFNKRYYIYSVKLFLNNLFVENQTLLCNSSNTITGPKILGIHNKKYIVVWKEIFNSTTSFIHTKYFDLTGNEEQEFIEEVSDNFINPPQLTKLDNDRLLLSWPERRLSPLIYVDIYSKIYDINGNLIENKFKLNNISTLIGSSYINTFTTKNYLISSFIKYKNLYAIYGSIYKKNGEIAYTDFIVDTNLLYYGSKINTICFEDIFFVIYSGMQNSKDNYNIFLQSFRFSTKTPSSSPTISPSVTNTPPYAIGEILDRIIYADDEYVMQIIPENYFMEEDEWDSLVLNAYIEQNGQIYNLPDWISFEDLTNMYRLKFQPKKSNEGNYLLHIEAIDTRGAKAFHNFNVRIEKKDDNSFKMIRDILAVVGTIFTVFGGIPCLFIYCNKCYNKLQNKKNKKSCLITCKICFKKICRSLSFKNETVPLMEIEK